MASASLTLCPVPWWVCTVIWVLWPTTAEGPGYSGGVTLLYTCCGGERLLWFLRASLAGLKLGYSGQDSLFYLTCEQSAGTPAFSLSRSHPQERDTARMVLWFSSRLPRQSDRVLKPQESSACPPVVPGKGAVKPTLPGEQVILVD